MKYLLICLCLANCLVASSQKEENGWYKMLVGTIGKYPVTMHLHKAGHSYSGYYSYNNQMKPIAFSGDDTTEKGVIRLVAGIIVDDSPEYFLFTLKNKKAEGTWKKSQTGKPLIFAAIEKASPLEFSNYLLSGERKLRPGNEGSPAASIELSAVWPLGNSEAAELVKNQVRAYFINQKLKEDVSQIFSRLRDEFFITYLEYNKETNDSDFLDNPHAYEHTLAEKLEIRDYSNNLLNLTASHYSYSGGAHGMYGTSYFVLDLQNRKRVKLIDLFVDNGIKAIDTLLEKYFRIQYNVAPNESLEDGGLFENSITANENFYITGKGIGFVYQPYEIASYAMGEIEIFIPFNEFSVHLKPLAKTYWK